jgi:hypothetical protein
LQITLFSVLLIATTFTNAATDNGKTNEVDPPPIRIDPILRKALLKALSNLEKDNASEVTDDDTTEATTNSGPDEILEESTSSVQTADVHYHSYIVQQHNNTQSDDDDNEIIKTIIITKPKTTLSPPLEDTTNDIQIKFDEPNVINEKDVQVQTFQVQRSVASSLSNDVGGEDKLLIKVTTEKVVKPVTTTTTTTTQPPPVTNADGENIEKVKENDVKIFQAPLVAAFTVRQNSDGQPQNVIPIYKSIQTQATKAPQSFSMNTFATTPVFTSQTTSSINSPVFELEQKNRELEQQILQLRQQQRRQEDLIRQQSYLQQQQNFQRQQDFIAQQQRQRAEEENRIYQQTRAEEEKRLFQQKRIEEQRFRAEEENRLRIQRLQQEQFRTNQLQQQQQQQQQQLQQQQQILSKPSFQQELPRTQTNIQFVPSINLPSNTLEIPVEQQLPIKEAVEFRSKGESQKFQAFLQNNQQTNQLQQRANFLPPQLAQTQQLPQRPFQQFNIQPQVARTRTAQVEIVPSQEQKTRVFRQETETGNFGFNQQVSQQQQQKQQQQEQQTFQQQLQQQKQQQQEQQNFQQQLQQQQFQQQQQRNFQQQNFQNFQNSNQNFQQSPSQFRSDNQLQNLLFQSGITSRSAEEDFNIISKVLALNHGIQPQTSNSLLGNRDFTRFKK